MILMTVTAHAFALNTSSDEVAVLDIFRHRNSLRQVKHFLQLATHRAVIRVSWHNVGHIFPPTLADFSAGYRIPAFFRFNLYHGKQQITRFVEVNGVVMRTVRFLHCFQFRPDGVMPTLILFVGVGVNLHDKGFADHVCSLQRQRTG